MYTKHFQGSQTKFYWYVLKALHILDTELSTCKSGEKAFSGFLHGLINVYKCPEDSKTLCEMTISTNGNWDYTDSDFIVCVSGTFYNLINQHEKVVEEVEYRLRRNRITCLTFLLEKCTDETFDKYALTKEDFKLSKDQNGVCVLNYVNYSEQQNLPPVDSLDEILHVVKIIYDKGREYPKLQRELRQDLIRFVKKVKNMDYLEKVIHDKTKITIEDVSETLDVKQLMVLDVAGNYTNVKGSTLGPSLKPKPMFE